MSGSTQCVTVVAGICASYCVIWLRFITDERKYSSLYLGYLAFGWCDGIAQSLFRSLTCTCSKHRDIVKRRQNSTFDLL